jgi:predicted DNA-binding transcriptional regulator AlpA
MLDNLNSAPEPELLDVGSVSALGVGSTRHVYRLSDAGRMPAPVKLGALVRWRRREILDWIDAGCPPIRTPRGPK